MNVRPPFLLGVWLVVGFGVAAAQEPEISQLHASFLGDRVRVSFEIERVFDEDLLEQIHSGIPVTFLHRIEIEAPKRFMLTTPRTLARTLVETRVSYDALTHRYELLRTTTLRRPRRKEGPPPLVELAMTDNLEQMQAWMTRCSDVVLYDPEGAIEGDDLSVVVETTLGRRYILWVLPARLTVKARKLLEP